MIDGNHQPFVLPGFKRRRQLLEESEPGSIPLYDSYTRVALSQGTADLSLELIDRLNGVPSGRPEEREQRRRRLVRVSFHGERERRVGIVGWLRLVDADIGQHGCAPAVAMRLTRDLRARHAVTGGWRRASNSGKLRQFGGECCDDVIQRAPRPEPAPAFLYRRGRQENPEETLRSPLAAHQRAISFGEGGCRKNQFGLCRGCGLQVVQNHHVLKACQKLVDDRGGEPPVEVVFKNDDGVHLGFERVIERGSIHQREAKAIALRRGECQRGARQCPRNIRRRLDERRTAIARA